MKTTFNKNREVIVLIVLMIFTFAFVYFYDYASRYSSRANIVKVNGSLPVVGSYGHLQRLLKQRFPEQSVFFRGIHRFLASDGADMVMEMADEDLGVSGNAMPAMDNEESKSAAAQTPDYSGTNLQVQGVDEADILKTDGRYIYHVNGQRIVVATAYPPEEMEITDIIDFEKDFYPCEMYLDERFLVVIGAACNEIPAAMEPADAPVPEAEIEIYPPPFHYQSTVKVKIFDIADKSKIKEEREIEIEGSYVSSRKIDAALYFVVNKNIDYYRIMRNEKPMGQNSTPSYCDTADSADFVHIGYDEIRYFPEFTEPNYMIVGGINLDKIKEKVELQTFLGAGENIYASRENLYVAVTGYEFKGMGREDSHTVTSTTLYKFALQDGAVAYKEKGEVPGRVLNQFSMDEHNNYFRLATTSGDAWRDDEHTSKNNVYILDKTLKIVGKVEGVAPGETIYAARFMGDRGYMVTFRTTDPLYVLDLKDPRNPRILGELKIPGYSDYLHPYDENHLLGFGKEAEEVLPGDQQGDVAGRPFVLQQGMKVALFDVTDVTKPVEKYNITIGGRGTDSELLRNHKALLFNKERNLLAFPITVVEDRRGGGTEDGFYEGEFVFQG
ncbi:MAG: beta-propeller domain-containing protein, partial [Dethiobacteria bacterium]